MEVEYGDGIGTRCFPKAGTRWEASCEGSVISIGSRGKAGMSVSVAENNVKTELSIFTPTCLVM